MVVDFALQEIDQAAMQLIAAAAGRKIFAFHGEMGAGKTTLIHAICQQLNIKDAVGSPTFSIINEYRTGSGEIVYHLDLYRLKDESEAIAAGVEDCLYAGNMCLVEWPEKAPGLFPDDTVHCYLKSTGHNHRKLQINL
ncbi:MAG: tRNA (adenosine(37)-N6)-threonylcarbamoyltransferase complex ATPase subunit type 1 TsaE [Ferruginibacter sp.]|jgi:tRNA threonylcarbamoyladenosine biosynthesis protein TsaE|nr:tRNA (adenosine(37)-N6)-threonylcarbamoyltransferase complex ATPase subunit type 1 TsaE [Ferruginibacter sp.]